MIPSDGRATTGSAPRPWTARCPVRATCSAAGSETCSTRSSAAPGPVPDAGEARSAATTARSSSSSTFREAVFGTTRELTFDTPVGCATCEGTGARAGTTAIRCTECQGSGELHRVRQSILGQVVTATPCGRCNGSGEVITSPCPDCRGDGRVMETRTFNVDVPAGVDHGSTLRLSGRGPAGPRGGPPGDLYVHLAVPARRRLRARRGRRPRRIARVDRPGRPGRQPGVRDARRNREARRASRHPDRAPDPAARSGCAPCSGARARRPRRPGGGGHADAISPRRKRNSSASFAAESGEDVGPPDEGLMSRLRSAFG